MFVLRLVVSRVLLSLLTLLLVSIIIFAMLEVLPGDVASRILGRDATPESLAALRAQLHLDQPAPLRYLDWLGGILRGDFGEALIADAPCTGLGALRRRPEVRWRRTEEDVVPLVELQLELLAGALASVRPGGVVAYVTCSPHTEETVGVLDAAAARDDVEVLPVAPLFPEVPDLARGDFGQLWPHRHGTDAMFMALLRRRS